MKNQEEIDQLIRKALTAEEAKFYEQLDEQNVQQMVGGLFSGKNKWMNVISLISMPFLFAGAIYCAFQFAQASEIKEMMVWCTGTFFLMIALGFLKLYNLMQMDKNAIIREIKRMELQVAVLNKKLGDKV